MTIRGFKVRPFPYTPTNPIFKIVDTLWIGGSEVPNPTYNLLLNDGCIVQTGRPTSV